MSDQLIMISADSHGELATRGDVGFSPCLAVDNIYSPYTYFALFL